MNNINNANTIIIGISKDSIKSHLNFKTKYELPFIILSDPNLEAINAYNVYEEKSMYGRKYMGVVRSTFIIDEKGFIGIFTGGLTSCSGGIAAAILSGLLVSLIFKAKDKSW